MPGTTITGAYVTGITLSLPTQNPFSVATGASVLVGGGYTPALLAQSGIGWTIGNSGSLGAQYGISLNSTGTINNFAGGAITGRRDGIRSGYNSPITVFNAGTIGNTGTLGQSGVRLQGGGSVTNTSGGIISGVSRAVYIRNGGMLTNQAGGTINGFVQVLDAVG